MPKLFLNRRTLGAPPVVTQPSGLVIHYQPSGIQYNGAVTGWRNDADASITPSVGAVGYTAADPRFNGQSTVTLDRNNYFGGVPFAATDGVTIITVDKHVVTANNEDGCMPWLLSLNEGGTLDLWTLTRTNTARGLNGFSGENYGFEIPDGSQANTEIVTVTIPVTDTGGAQFYRNGEAQPASVIRSAVPSKNISGGILYPGHVPNNSQYSFEGAKAEFRLYNRILSASELATVHAKLRAKYLPGVAADLTWNPSMQRDLRNHRVVVPGFGQHMPGTSKTIEFWVKMASSGQVTTTFTVLNQELFPDPTNRVLTHVYWTDGNVYWDNGDINATGRVYAYRPHPLAIGDWVHMAFTVDAAANTMSMYANGMLFASRSGYGTYTPAPCDFQMGGAEGQRQQGNLSEFRVWDYAKTGDQILADMNKSFAGPKPGLIGCWRLDDSDDIIRDRSGNNYHGALMT